VKPVLSLVKGPPVRPVLSSSALLTVNSIEGLRIVQTKLNNPLARARMNGEDDGHFLGDIVQSQQNLS